MKVKMYIFTSRVEHKVIDVEFRDNKDFTRFAKKVQRKLKRNEYITIGGISEAYTLRTFDIINIHYEVIEREERKHG